jgi:hypothetical protein
MPAEAHARLNRNCEHVISYGYIPNPNVPEDFQKDDKQAGNGKISLFTTVITYSIGCVIDLGNIGKISLFTAVTIYGIECVISRDNIGT